MIRFEKPDILCIEHFVCQMVLTFKLEREIISYNSHNYIRISFQFFYFYKHLLSKPSPLFIVAFQELSMIDDNLRLSIDHLTIEDEQGNEVP